MILDRRVCSVQKHRRIIFAFILDLGFAFFVTLPHHPPWNCKRSPLCRRPFSRSWLDRYVNDLSVAGSIAWSFDWYVVRSCARSLARSLDQSVDRSIDRSRPRSITRSETRTRDRSSDQSTLWEYESPNSLFPINQLDLKGHSCAYVFFARQIARR